MSGPLFTNPASRRSTSLKSWPLLPVPGEDGTLRWPGEALSVRQSVEIILRTARGEMLRRENWGAGLPAMLGAPNTLETRNAIASAITRALSLHEPRLQIVDLAVEQTDDPRRVDIVLAYRLVNSGEPALIRASVNLGGDA